MDSKRKKLQERGFVFPILAASINIRTGWAEKATLAKEHVHRIEQMVSITNDEEKEARNDFKLKELQVPVINFKHCYWRSLENIATMVSSLKKFIFKSEWLKNCVILGTLSVLDSSPFG